MYNKCIYIYTNLLYTYKSTSSPLGFFPKQSDPQHAPTPYRSQNASTTKAVIAFISQTPGRLKFQKRLLKRVYRGWNPTQLCGEYVINHEIRIPFSNNQYRPWKMNGWFTYSPSPIKKGTWSEPNLQGIEFQPLIFRGVPKTSTNYIKWLAISWMMNVIIQWIGIQHPFMFHGQLSCFMIWYQIHPQRLSVEWWDIQSWNMKTAMGRHWKSVTWRFGTPNFIKGSLSRSKKNTGTWS